MICRICRFGIATLSVGELDHHGNGASCRATAGSVSPMFLTHFVLVNRRDAVDGLLMVV